LIIEFEFKEKPVLGS